MQPTIHSLASRFLLLLAVLCLATPAESTATVIHVVGQDDASVDRPALQAAIDAASPGMTISLAGTFQLDGERVLLETPYLTLAGEAVDNDGDGATNEDWPDGVDNDGDGQVDEDGWDTHLRGVLADNGRPARVDGENALWNRALVVEGASGTLRGLTIRNLHLSGFHRGIDLTPEWGSPTGGCADRFHTGGKVHGMRLVSNHFAGNALGVLGLGDVRSLRAERNLFTEHEIGGLFMEGGRVGCPLVDGSSVELTLGTPLRTRIEDNRFENANALTSRTRWSRFEKNDVVGGLFGLSANFDERMVIRRNRMEGLAVSGMFLLEMTDSLIADNTIRDTFAGIDLAGVATRTVLLGNRIEGTLYGLLFAAEARHYFVFGPTIVDSLFAGVFLEAGSSENTVINFGAAVTATDLGTANELIGNFTDP